jgi:hypothetical protein
VIFAPATAGEPTATTVGVTEAPDFEAALGPHASRKISNAVRVDFRPRYALTPEFASKRDGRLAGSSWMGRQGGSEPADRFLLAGSCMAIRKCLGELAG